mmetsp:Transcript_35563/g.72454  ORF Transcript_35563/g.72454 Transcript_35563/m.72454 type:complete len:369 (-) Transcript_35563:242-1348(-)
MHEALAKGHPLSSFSAFFAFQKLLRGRRRWRRRQQAVSLIVKLLRGAARDEVESAVQVRVGHHGLARSNLFPKRLLLGSLEGHAHRAPAFHQNASHLLPRPHRAPSVLLHPPPERSHDAPASTFGVLEHGVGAVEVFQHVRHHHRQGLVRGHPLEQERQQVHVVPQERVCHLVLVQVEGIQHLRGVLEQSGERERVLQAKRQQHAPVAAHRGGGEPHDSFGQRAKLGRQIFPFLEGCQAAVPPQDLLEVLCADAEGVPFGHFRQVGSPNVVRDPFWFFLDHLEDALQRVRAVGWGKAAEQGRAGFESEHRWFLPFFFQGFQTVRWNRFSVHPHRPVVRTPTKFVVRLKHADTEPPRGEERCTGQPSQS